MSEEIEKEYIELPDLPNVVQGDGRYLMTQLRKYLASIAQQVNLANGFKSKEETGTSGYAAPSNFTLTFSMEGGLFKWDDPSYFKQVAYYETRTDTNVGTIVGRLDVTPNNFSDKMPIMYAGRVYLYAILQDGTISNGAILDYNKKRPEKPQDINLSKNEQGTLINFTFIPLDCIGAHIYINGYMYTTQDNWLLYTGNATQINEVQVAYYDSFGEGEKGYLYCHVPNVTGFLVERNGAVLDFYWDSVGINGASYSVRVSTTPIWENGLELFRTSLLKKKMEYPNTGDLYFLIKALDEHGNLSESATWFLLKSKEDQQKNIIMSFNEHANKYTGNKLNTYYDAEAAGLRLTDGSYTGEYLSAGNLPYVARARNWADYKLSSSNNSDITFSDLDFSIKDDKAKTITMVGGLASSLEGTEVTTYIAERLEKGLESVLEVSLNGTTETVNKEKPVESQHCDEYVYARWFKGIKQNELTRLKYEIKPTVTTFSFLFNIKMTTDITSCTIALIHGDGGELLLSYRDGFLLEGSDGNNIYMPFKVTPNDMITFGISQGENSRTLYVKKLDAILSENVYSKAINAPPVGAFNMVQFYK